ncbi:RNA-binding KH domain-containing protein RCF3-like isoform X1 [Silene latifolia]|uniref:RNA-binding KH domain-containing protein RCF3-like isoform X1 n=1 Tax=Silene latifolia TaxID=37657 RepID=UPI003D7826BD
MSKPPILVPRDHVEFRLLAAPAAGGAVIGYNGAIQKAIVRDTGAMTIRVDDTLPGCVERVIHVVGPAKVDRTVIVKDNAGGVARFQLSAAQAALLRVYEIVGEERAAVYGCRLLVVSGGEVWKRDAEMKRIERESGAVSVRVLSPELLPLCAHISDELIQITGASLAVKKAMIAVTHGLQGEWKKSSHSRGSTSRSLGPSRDLVMEKEASCVMESGDRNQSHHSDVDIREVAFRLICPAHVSGGLVGWEETVIKNMEQETGASIVASPPIVGCDEFVIKVSAMESKDWQYSPAQNAAACVFIRSMDDSTRSGHASVGTSEATVKAKLLIPFNQADGVDLQSNMLNTEVQILDVHQTQLASAGGKIIQIVGELSDVHVCLFQVTWALREKMFLVKKNVPRLPHEILGRPPQLHQTAVITKAIDHLAISDQPKARPSKLFPGDLLTLATENQVDSDAVTSASSSEHGSEDGQIFIRNTEVEIVIPATIFGCVYGKDGCNIARVRQITGATIIFHDPSPGNDGRAIISGTFNQTQAAFSMLQAFINEG